MTMPLLNQQVPIPCSRETQPGENLCVSVTLVVGRIHGPHFCTMKGRGRCPWGQSPHTRRKLPAILFPLPSSGLELRWGQWSGAAESVWQPEGDKLEVTLGSGVERQV